MLNGQQIMSFEPVSVGISNAYAKERMTGTNDIV